MNKCVCFTSFLICEAHSCARSPFAAEGSEHKIQTRVQQNCREAARRVTKRNAKRCKARELKCPTKMSQCPRGGVWKLEINCPRKHQISSEAFASTHTYRTTGQTAHYKDKDGIKHIMIKIIPWVSTSCARPNQK